MRDLNGDDVQPHEQPENEHRQGHWTEQHTPARQEPSAHLGNWPTLRPFALSLMGEWSDPTDEFGACSM
jgi:hypothetical protein